MDLAIIQNKIYEIRGERVILDKDLAGLYQVTTGNLNKAVKRNLSRFPDKFMFQLNQDECANLIFQNGISSWGGTRKLPYAFTEHGIAMLSAVLKSDVAINVSIQIIEAFVAMRRFLLSSTQNKEIVQVKKEIEDLKRYIEDVFTDFNDINEDTSMQLELINETLAKLSSTQEAIDQQLKRKKIGFKKQ